LCLKTNSSQINLELRFAHAVIGTNEPLLKIANGAIGKWYRRFRTFAQCGSQRLNATDVFEARLGQTFEALEAIGVDSRSGSHILSEERNDGLGLEGWNHSHSNTSGALASFFHRHKDERRSPPFELSASSQTGLLTANPRLINFYLAVQRLTKRVHHRPSEFMKHHPDRLVVGQTEMVAATANADTPRLSVVIR
jgi:hypothetical protein